MRAKRVSVVFPLKTADFHAASPNSLRQCGNSFIDRGKSLLTFRRSQFYPFEPTTNHKSPIFRRIRQCFFESRENIGYDYLRGH
jgi:hypothetical protein